MNDTWARLAEQVEGNCPGGLPWSACLAEDCGVAEDGSGCDLAEAVRRVAHARNPEEKP